MALGHFCGSYRSHSSWPIAAEDLKSSLKMKKILEVLKMRQMERISSLITWGGIYDEP